MHTSGGVKGLLEEKSTDSGSRFVCCEGVRVVVPTVYRKKGTGDASRWAPGCSQDEMSG